MSLIQSLYEDIYQKSPTLGSHYHKISLKENADKQQYLSLFTKWIGNEKKHEVRVSDLVLADKVCEDFKYKFKQNISVIDELSELKAFLAVGGHALLNDELAHAHWKEVVAPKISVRQDFFDGYVDYASLSQTSFKRRALGMFRMEIMTRDRYRCRICGKHEDDGEDVRLQVHHIQPWSEGGLTIAANLITLCTVCHEGIAVVDRNYLLEKVNVEMPMYGTHFLTMREPDEYCRAKIRYFDYNSVTLKLPNLKK